MEIQVGHSVNADGSSPTIDLTTSKSINIAAGKHATFRFSTLIPIGFVPGTYFGVADVDANDSFNETDTSNNSAVTTNELTVLDPFANIMNTFTGPFKTTSGFGKGATGTITLDILSESDTTGDVTGTGSNSLGNSFTFTGAILANGNFLFNTTDMANSVTWALTGKVLPGAGWEIRQQHVEQGDVYLVAGGVRSERHLTCQFNGPRVKSAGQFYFWRSVGWGK